MSAQQLDRLRCGFCGDLARHRLCQECADELVARGIYSDAVMSALLERARRIKLSRMLRIGLGF